MFGPPRHSLKRLAGSAVAAMSGDAVATRQANFFGAGKVAAVRRSEAARRARGEEVEEDPLDVEADLARLAIARLPELLEIFRGDDGGELPDFALVADNSFWSSEVAASLP